MRSLLILNVIAIALTANGLPLSPDMLLDKKRQIMPTSDIPSVTIPCYRLIQHVHD